MTEEWNDFIFDDSGLQARLIRALEASGLPHKVAEDGRVLYSPGHSIEEQIGEVVDSVFAAYYRTEIPDLARAERYRRFTKRHGTLVIEEHRNGHTFFVQVLRERPFRHRGVPTHASLVLLWDDLVPEDVTSRLGMVPTFACRKGEILERPCYSSLRRRDAPPRPSRTGWWEVASIPHVQSNDLDRHLAWLLGQLERVAEDLRQMADPPTPNGRRILELFVVRPEPVGGISLSGAMLLRLASLCDRLDVSLWTEGS